MARQPKAAERGRRGQRAPDHGPRQARLQQVGLPGPPRHDVVDLEGDADAEQQRQRDDVGEIQRHPDQHADLERHEAGEQQRHQRQQHVAETPQHDPQQDRDRHQREDAGVDEGPHDRLAGLQDRDRRADRFRKLRLDGARKAAQRFVVVGIALRRRLDPHAAVGGDPLVLQPAGQVLLRHRAGLQVISQARQRGAQRHDEGRVGRVALVRAGSGELGQARGQTIGRVGAGAARLAGQLRQRVGGALQRGDRLRVGRRTARCPPCSTASATAAPDRGSARACGPDRPGRTRRSS